MIFRQPLKAEPSSTASGTVLSWRSLDDGSSVIYRIAGQLHPDWSLSLLFSKRYDTHYFLIWHPNGSAPAPAENPILGVKDAAMIAKLEANFQDMNDTVAAAAAVARSAPPSAPPVSGERKYYRINADWSVDTDGDGNQDWMEFEVAADVSHPDHSLGSTFNADADGDGITDGKEADFDRDGISNAEDASKGDQLINWTSQPTPRYALFELHGTPDPSTPEGKPFHVTDRGGVPFRKGVWKTNVYHELILDSNEVRGARVVAMGESGRILGIGGVDNNEDENVDTSVMVYWDNTDGEPEVIEEDGGATGKVYATPRYDMSYGLLDTGTLLDSNDNFFAGKQSLVWTEPQGDPPVPPKPFELLEITNALWTLPGASGTEPTHAGAPPHATNLIDTATFWGNDYTQGEHGKLVLTGGGGNIIADSTASRVAVTPSGGFFAGSSSFGGTALMTANNGWQSAVDLSRASDVSS